VVVGRSLAVGARLAALLVIARSHPPDELAAFALALALADVVRVVADCGVDVFSLREYGRDHDALDHTARSVFATKLLAGGIAAIASVAIVLGFVPAARYSELLPIAALPATQLLITYFLQLELARGRVRRLLWPLGSAYGLSFSLLAVMALLHMGTAHAFWIVALCEAAAAAYLWAEEGEALTRAGLWAQTLGGDVLRLLRRSFPIGLASMLGIIYYKLDLLIVSYLLPAHDVGLYGLASRLVDPLNMIGGSWIATLGATFARRWQRDRSEYRHASMRLLASAAAAGVVFCIIMGIVAFGFLGRWFPAYADGAFLVFLLGAVLITRQLNYALTTLLISAGREGLMPGLAFLVTVVGLTFVALGASLFGVKGAAFGLLTGDAFAMVVQALLWRRRTLQQSHA
jgi:O-antigen/teichoic acid export membrane protein